MKLGRRTSGSLLVASFVWREQQRGSSLRPSPGKSVQATIVWAQTSTLFEVCERASWVQSSHFIVAKNKVDAVWKSRCTWNISFQTRARKIKALFGVWCHVLETVPFCQLMITDRQLDSKSICGKSKYSGAWRDVICHILHPSRLYCTGVEQWR